MNPGFWRVAPIAALAVFVLAFILSGSALGALVLGLATGVVAGLTADPNDK